MFLVRQLFALVPKISRSYVYLTHVTALFLNESGLRLKQKVLATNIVRSTLCRSLPNSWRQIHEASFLPSGKEIGPAPRVL